jgi:hypothetical protein
MRILVTLVSVVLSGSSLADSVRHLSVPERFWGTWAPSPGLGFEQILRLQHPEHVVRRAVVSGKS